MIGIAKVLMLVIILVVCVIFSYKLFYTYKINKKIQSGEVQGRKLVDMSRMVMIAVITGLAIFSGVQMYVINDYSSRAYTVHTRNDYAVIDVSDEKNYKYISYMGNMQLEDASFAKMYSREKNEGYKKDVILSGDYEFIVFTRTSPADNFHPDFLCFIQYVGEKNCEWISCNKSGFRSITEKGNGFNGESIGDIEDSVLYVGNLEKDCCFDIEINLLNSKAENAYQEAIHAAYEEDKGDFPEAGDFAVSTAKVSIVIE